MLYIQSATKPKKQIMMLHMGRETKLLLTIGARILLTANLWTKLMVRWDILFRDQGPPSLPVAVLASFDKELKRI